MTNTSRLALPAIEAAQAQKHVTHNEALVLIDATTQLAVEKSHVSSAARFAWGGRLLHSNSRSDWGVERLGRTDCSFQWGRLDLGCPVSGFKAWVKAERLTITYEDGLWRDGIALTFHGGRVTLRAKEEELTLAGPFVDTTDPAFIPDRGIVLGVSSRTTQAITGATSYGVGVVGNTTQFGNILGAALGSTNNGVVGPTAFYADTKVRVTANGGNFTAGKVRLIVYFLEMSVPSS